MCPRTGIGQCKHIDFWMVFDRVDHMLSYYKKGVSFGFPPNLIKLLKSYLIGRRQFVFFNGFFFESVIVNSGAPEGSTLSPLPSTIFINDLVDGTKHLKSSTFGGWPKKTQVYLRNKLLCPFVDDIYWTVHRSMVIKLPFAPEKCSVMRLGPRICLEDYLSKQCIRTQSSKKTCTSKIISMNI